MARRGVRKCRIRTNRSSRSNLSTLRLYLASSAQPRLWCVGGSAGQGLLHQIRDGDVIIRQTRNFLVFLFLVHLNTITGILTTQLTHGTFVLRLHAFQSFVMVS